MTKTLNVSAIVIGALLIAGLSFSVASAATITNVEFGGNTEVSGTPGANKTATFRVDVPAGEAVEYIETEFTGGPVVLAPKCNAVGGSSGLQEGTHFVSLPLSLPNYPGLFDITVDATGIFGAISANGCDDGAAVHGAGVFGGIVRVLPTTSSSNEDLGNEESGLIAELRAIIKDLMAQIAELSKPTVPVKPAFCANIVIYNGVNAWAAQASLLANGFAAPFNAIGVYQPTGYWGTASASAAMQAANACQ